MVTAPEARPNSPAAAVSWQQSCQPDCDQSSSPVPLSIRFMQRRHLVTGGLIITDRLG